MRANKSWLWALFCSILLFWSCAEPDPMLDEEALLSADLTLLSDDLKVSDLLMEGAPEEFQAAVGRIINHPWGKKVCQYIAKPKPFIHFEAYLDENGCFNAMAMLLVVSSHDAHDNMDFKPIVGISPSFPEKQYPLAIIELSDRYLFPRIRSVFKRRTKQQRLEDFEKIEGIKKTGKGFNTGFSALKHKADSLHIPMIIYLHAEQSELGNKQYNSQGEEIINFAKLNNIPIIKDLDFGLTPDWYRKGDNIHLSQYGQSKMAELIYPYLLEYCTKRE